VIHSKMQTMKLIKWVWKLPAWTFSNKSHWYSFRTHGEETKADRRVFLTCVHSVHRTQAFNDTYSLFSTCSTHSYTTAKYVYNIQCTSIIGNWKILHKGIKRIIFLLSTFCSQSVGTKRINKVNVFYLYTSIKTGETKLSWKCKYYLFQICYH
jgi:hypothetical protein